ncbi:MAG: alpha/beta hydrolase [Anaerobacillus sp.]|uniref:alpha/beta hydrolase n=1 Tax=Anaerobacillus sp. TaxID=1872506 RepID=UPI00391D0EE0
MINQAVQFDTVYESSDFGIESKELSLTTEDGYRISAFQVDVNSPKGIVIFISGIHNPSVTAFFGHAKLLSENGYASILYDMRAHGKSEGEVISLGHLETLDTQAVVDYIRSQKKYSDLPIIVYGLSMGGAVAINSTGQIPEISGLISISAYSSWEDVFIENMALSGAPKWLTIIQKPFVKLYTVYKYGLNTADIYPKKQIENLGDRPALIMHSTEDSQIDISNFERIIAQAPSHVETWTRDGDYHFFTTDFLHPENDKEYAQRVLMFLDSHFSD